MENQSLTLATAPVGKRYRILKLPETSLAKVALLGLGILEGDAVEIVGRSHFSGPTAIAHQSGASVALRREVAALILLQEILP